MQNNIWLVFIAWENVRLCKTFIALFHLLPGNIKTVMINSFLLPVYIGIYNLLVYQYIQFIAVIYIRHNIDIIKTFHCNLIYPNYDQF